MDWFKVTTLLTFLFVFGSAQRGGRRYIPDQPLEESLSVDNHRFTSRSRDVSGENRRGENHRTVTETTGVPSQRLHSSRTRVRTENSRQFHSIPAREPHIHETESNQFQSRRNLEPERKKLNSREDVQNERINAKETEINSDSGSRRNPGRGRGREDTKETGTNRRGSGVARFQSRVIEDTVSQSANHEPVRNRADVRRERTDTTHRGQLSRKNGLQDETRSLQRPAKPDLPTERIKTRSRTPSDVARVNPDEASGSHQIINEQQDLASKLDVSTKTNAIPEQYDHPENIVTNNGIDTNENSKQTEITEKVPPIKSNYNAEDVSSTLQPVLVSTENTLDYPTKLNDVEESRRASRKLDIQATERSVLRGRNRGTDDSSNKQNPDISIRSRGDSSEVISGRSRSSELRSRGRSQTIDSNRGSLSESTVRSRNSLDSERSINFETTPRSRLQEYTSRGRSSEENNRSQHGEPSRNRGIETNNRGRESVAGIKSRTSESNARNAGARGRASAEHPRTLEEDTGRSQPQLKGRSHVHDENSYQNSRDVANNKEATRGRQDISFRGRIQEPIQGRGSEGRRTSHKYSAKISDEAQSTNNEQQPSSLSRTRSKEISNFRSRSRTEDTSKLINSVTPTTQTSATETSLLLEPALQNTSEEKPSSNLLPEEKNEISQISPTGGTTITSTATPGGRSLSRKPASIRGRGHVKGPKLVKENDNSGEVSDDDNYPEVYKKLKKSGTDPREILVFHTSQK